MTGGDQMAAWAVTEPGPIDGHPIAMTRRPVPEPGDDELLVKVRACGVCRTDLHLVEGDLPVHRPNVVPGHEVVGRVERIGSDVLGFHTGDRVGVAWLRRTYAACRFCTSGRENLCLRPRFTGWDDDGGYAEYVDVPAAYAYPIPDAFDDVHAAPLLCPGIIGFRALERAAVPSGGSLGIYGSADPHIWRRRSRCIAVPSRTCSPVRRRPDGSPSNSVVPVLARPTTHRRSRSTRPSSLPR